MARRYTRRNLASRVQRYVIDVDWMEWDEGFREHHDKPRNRAKILVDMLARRIARSPEKFSDIEQLLHLRQTGRHCGISGSSLLTTTIRGLCCLRSLV